MLLQFILAGLKYKNFEWSGDSLVINLWSYKERKDGKGLHDRHIYANPVNSKTSVLFALSMYSLTSTEPNSTGLLLKSKHEEKEFLIIA